MAAKSNDFAMNDYVLLKGKEGFVRYVGEREHRHGIWYGIALKTGNGPNDGSEYGKRYFSCKHGKGIFVRLSAIKCKLKPPDRKSTKVTLKNRHSNKSKKKLVKSKRTKTKKSAKVRNKPMKKQRQYRKRDFGIEKLQMSKTSEIDTDTDDSDDTSVSLTEPKIGKYNRKRKVTDELNALNKRDFIVTFDKMKLTHINIKSVIAEPQSVSCSEIPITYTIGDGTDENQIRNTANYRDSLILLPDTPMSVGSIEYESEKKESVVITPVDSSHELIDLSQSIIGQD